MIKRGDDMSVNTEADKINFPAASSGVLRGYGGTNAPRGGVFTRRE